MKELIALTFVRKIGFATIHDIQCPFLGQTGSFHCNCPKRLASNTVEGIINQLVNIFDDIGLGRDWNIQSKLKDKETILISISMTELIALTFVRKIGFACLGKT
jgi:hypothetical protein